MKKFLFAIVCSIVFFSCSEGSKTDPINPDPVKPEKVYLTISFNDVRIIPSHEKTYSHIVEEFQKDLAEQITNVPYSDFAKDSVAIFSKFVADVKTVVDKYSKKYPIYGQVIAAKSLDGINYRLYDRTPVDVYSSKDAFVLVSEAKGRDKSGIERKLVQITDELDSKNITAADIDKITPYINELILGYKDNLVCGTIRLFRTYYLGNDAQIEGIKDWDFPTPPTLYELTASDNFYYHDAYTDLYRELVLGIEFNKPRTFESEDKALAIANEVYDYLNGRFFNRSMSLTMSKDCFETYETVKSLDIKMAPNVWSAEPATIKSSLKTIVNNAVCELEPAGICYKDDYHEFKEAIRTACKQVKDVNEIVNILQCNVEKYYLGPTIVDTLVIK